MLAMRSAILERTANQRALREKAGPLELRPKVASFSGVEGYVAQEVVPSGAVSPSAAHKRMVPITVHHAITKVALKVFLGEADSQPPLKHSDEHGRLVVQFRRFAGKGLQKLARVLSTHKAKMGTARLGGVG